MDNNLKFSILKYLENPVLVLDKKGKIIFKNDKTDDLFTNHNKKLETLIDKIIYGRYKKCRTKIGQDSYRLIITDLGDQFLLIQFLRLKKRDIFISFVSNLLKSTESLILLISNDFKQIYYCNKTFEKQFGISKKLLKFDPSYFYQLIHPKDKDKFFNLSDIKKQTEIELRIKNNKNEYHWYKLTLYNFVDNDISYYMGILNDINIQKEKELKLNETNFRFKSVMSHLPESIWIISFDKDLFYINKTIKNIIGYDVQEIESINSLIKLIHPDYKNLFMKKWKDLREKGELFDIEFPILHKNKYYKWVKETVFHSFQRGEITYYEGIIRDIDKENKELLIKDVIYKITTAIYNSKDLYSLCRIIHFNMNRLFNTSNLFFALYDEQTNYFTVPYEMDQKDKFESFPADNTLSNYVIKLNKPILLKLDEIKKLKAEGKINYIGTVAKIWMGTPLIYDNKPIGIISLQDYENENHFNEDDLKTLNLLSYQIAQSIMFKMTEIKLMKRENENQAILNVVPDMMFQMDKNGRFISYKGSNFYIPPEKFLGKKVEEVLPLNLANKIYKAIDKALAGEDVVKLEYKLAKGEEEYFEARIIKIDEEKVLSIIRNITDSKKYTMAIENSLKEKNLLLKEIHHRVKNNMQIISSLLNIQINNNSRKESNKVIKEVQSRIRSMSLIHEKLYENDDFSQINLSNYINALIAQLISMFSDECPGIELKTDIKEYNFDLNIAIPLGLLINEIILLILKNRAFKNKQKRMFSISLFDEEEKYHLIIKNTGASVKEYLKNDNINYKIIKILVYQLDGIFFYNEKNSNEIKIEFSI